MNNIRIDSGKKRYTINGNPEETIEFNPSDPAILTRFNTALGKISNIEKELDLAIDAEEGSDEYLKAQAEALGKIDGFVREQIDYIFDGRIADIVFKNTSSTSTADGVPYFERLINALYPIVEKDVQEEQKKQKQRLQKYTAKYKKK